MLFHNCGKEIQVNCVTLFIENNNFGNDGAQLLLSMLKTNYFLTNILSDQNKCSGSMVVEIEKEIVNNRV